MRFLGGFFAGVISTIIALFFLFPETKTNEEIEDLKMFTEKGECITKQELEVFQTVKPNMALANFGRFPDEVLVLLINHEGKTYYDKQKIKIPANMCARQTGTYQYINRMDVKKTVPVVVIDDSK